MTVCQQKQVNTHFVLYMDCDCPVAGGVQGYCIKEQYDGNSYRIKGSKKIASKRLALERKKK